VFAPLSPVGFGLAYSLWPFSFLLPLWLRRTLSIPPIRDLKTARPLALNDDLAVPLAQFDLANVSARAVNLFGDQGRAFWASAFFTSRCAFASVDAEGCRGSDLRRDARCGRTGLGAFAPSSRNIAWSARERATIIGSRRLVYTYGQSKQHRPARLYGESRFDTVPTRVVSIMPAFWTKAVATRAMVARISAYSAMVWPRGFFISQ